MQHRMRGRSQRSHLPINQLECRSHGGSSHASEETRSSRNDAQRTEEIHNRKRAYESGIQCRQLNARHEEQIKHQGSYDRCSNNSNSLFQAGIKPPRAHGPQQPLSVNPSTVFQEPMSETFSERNDQDSKRSRWDETIEDSTTPGCVASAALDITSFLPEDLCKQYRSSGKTGKLFSWQAECLCAPGVLDGKNIVYCAPTSAGKSLVAEILILRKLSYTCKAAMLVLPFVALCSEKSTHLEMLLKPLGKRVRRFYGSQNSPIIFRQDTGVLVCTIEKANMLVNRMIEEGILDELGIVVVDELHMVDDPYRGYLLELMLTKLRYMSMQHNTNQSEGLQIVGMSATMPNGKDVAQWLGAELFVTQTRPVPLRQFLKVGTSILDESGNQVRQLEVSPTWTGDPTHIAWLTKETIDRGHSVLVFCCSKKACEICAQHIADLVHVPKRELKGGRRRESFLNELQHIVGEYQKTLADLIPRGVAFHHAGLSSEERELVESAYKSGAVSVLAATSTLAAGVNLPARRVIFREPYVGLTTNVLDATSYRQMAGRAGRAGIDDEGEAYLLESKYVKVGRLQALIGCDAQPVTSCLGKEQNGMVRLLLEVISNGAVKTGSDIEHLIQSTLLAQMPEAAASVFDAANDALTWLKSNQLILWHQSTPKTAGMWTGSCLSQAIVSSGMDPRECALVKKDLLEATHHLILASDLQLTYLVTPYNVDITVDWEKLYYMVHRLSVTDASIADLVGVNMAFLQRRSEGDSSQQNLGEERIARRFYAALILRDVISEVPLSEICRCFKLSHGVLEGLQEKALRYANMSASFCGSLGWIYLQVVISEFQKRIYGGARPEIVHLTEIPFVKAHRARLLYKAGFRSVEAIAELTSIERLAKVVTGDRGGVDGKDNGLDLHIARRIVRGARTVLRNKLNSIQDETKVAAEIVGGDTTTVEEPAEEEEVSEDEAPCSVPKLQTRSQRQQSTSKEAELTASLRRLSFDPMPFVNAQGIVVLHTQAETRALCQHLLITDKWHVSFQSHLCDSLSDFHTELIGVAISWSEDVVAYVTLLDDAHEKLSHIAEIMESTDMQKSTFDLAESMTWIQQLLQETTLPSFPCLIDVQEAAKILKNTSPTMKDMAGLYLSFGLEEEFRQIKEFYSTTSQQTCSRFRVLPCCSLAVLTWKLWTVLQGELDLSGLRDYCLQIKMPHVHISESLSERGLVLSRAEVMRQLSWMDGRIEELQDNATHFSGTPFDCCSSQQVKDILFGRIGLQEPHLGLGQDDEILLRALQDQHPLPAVILQCKQWMRVRGCFTQMLDKHSPDGNTVLLREDLFHQVLSSWVENEQDLIKGLPLFDVGRADRVVYMSLFGMTDDADTKQLNIIGCINRREGFELVTVEYRHLGIWLLAHFSQDDELINALAHSDGDPFRAIACAMTGSPYNKAHTITQTTVDYFQRFLTGFLTGSGPLLCAYILRVSEKRANDSYNGFSSFFKGVGQWLRLTTDACQSQPEIRTLYGQRLHIDAQNVERQAIRCLIQGSVSDILKSATILIKQKLEPTLACECDLLFQQDHGFVVEVAVHKKESCIQLISEALSEAVPLNLPIPVPIQTTQQ